MVIIVYTCIDILIYILFYIYINIRPIILIKILQGQK